MIEDYVEEHPILDAIREYICKTYNLVYNKRFRLYLDGDSYSIYFELNNWERPIMIGGQFETDEAFIAYVEKEFREKNLYRTAYFSGYQENLPMQELVGKYSARGRELIKQNGNDECCT